MKKIFTLIAATMMAVCANAQDWNASTVSSLGEGTVLVNNNLAEIKTALQAANAVEIKNESDVADPKTYGGYTFSKYVGLRSSDTPSASNPAGTAHEQNITLVITAKKDVDVVVYYKRGASKSINCYDQTDPSSVPVKEETGIESTTYPYMIGTFVLQEGHVYTIYATGGTVQLNGLSTKEGTYVAPSSIVYGYNAGTNKVTYKDGASMQITGNAQKNFGSGSNINGTQSIKNSNGAEMTFWAPEGKAITKVTFSAVTNHESESGVLREVNGETINSEVTSHKDFSNPTSYTYEFSKPVSDFKFTYATKQVYFIMEVTYGEASGIKNVTSTASAAKVVKCIENGQLVIKAAKGTFNVAGARIK